MSLANDRPGCQARQYSDQMQCGKCGLAWDVNDEDPPECQVDKKPAPMSGMGSAYSQPNTQNRGREVLDQLRKELSNNGN